MPTARTQPRTRRAAMLAAAAIAALLTLAPTALAARDPIASGTTDFHLKKGFQRKLANLGVQVSGLGSGTFANRKVGLSVNGGKLDPTDAQGFLETGGGFKLGRGQRGVPVTEVTVNTVKDAVFAEVAKARMQLAQLSAFTPAREGFGAEFKAPKLTLTAKAAKRISNRLGLKGGQRIDGGRVMSNSFSSAQPSTVTILPQGSATLVGNTTTLAKFAAKGVELPEGISALPPASKLTPVSFLFPIAGGTLAPDASTGTVQTSGTIQILKKAEPFSPLMKLANIHVDFATRAATVEIEIGPTPPFPGAAGRTSIADVVIPSGGVIADPAARTITIVGADARLQAVAAATLNSVFNQPPPAPPAASDFVVGDSFGTFSAMVQAQ